MSDYLLAALPMAGAVGGGVISGETMIPVGAAIGAIIAIWKISGRFTELVATLKQNTKDIAAIKHTLETRPCVGSKEACKLSQPIDLLEVSQGD